jgi:dihydrodipicolinate synthase/N-acetylneuraminate lyase
MSTSMKDSAPIGLHGAAESPRHVPKRFPCGVMATCCVPWSADWHFAEEIFRRQVRMILAQGTRHVYIFGTAGEGYAVTERQFDQVAEAFADEMRQANAEPMVGLIGTSLAQMQERIVRLRDLGVTLFQVSLPCWATVDERELFPFFSGICGRFPDCRFLHYNLTRAGRLVTPAEYGRLAAEHENLVATKNSTSDTAMIESLLESAPQVQHFLTEKAFAHGSLHGECGLLASVSSINWRRARELFAAGRSRDLGRLRPLMAASQAITAALLSGLAGTAHVDGAYDKMFCRLHDQEFPLRLLPPYASADDGQFLAFRDFLEREHPDWLPGSP